MITPVTFKRCNYTERKKEVNGLIFLQAKYLPRSEELFYNEFRSLISNYSPVTEDYIDKFEHLNDFLTNEFTEASQHGTLMVELTSVRIPQRMRTAEADAEGAENKVFMIKLKIGNEMKNIFVGTPDLIYGDQDESIRIFTKVQSLRDTVLLEFYDVL